MRTLSFCLIFLSFTLICCNNIPKEKITIIENLTLGVSSDSLNNEMKSKSISIDRFTTEYLIIDRKQLVDESNFINANYTNLFNTVSDQSQEHIGLLFPRSLSGTNNIIGMTVLLGHTKTPLFLGEAKQYDYMNRSKCVKQSINEKLITQIKEMYISKYGTPKSEITSESNSVYSINNGKFESKISNEINAKTITWETEFLTIKFFTGLKNYNKGCYYKPRDKFYLDVEFTGVPTDYSNKMDCYSYAYIEYSLKDKTIEELKLKNSNF
jgi:hypothetical protein